MNTVMDDTRLAVWNFLCDLHMNVRYYDAMGDKLQSRHRLIRFITLSCLLIEGLLLYVLMNQLWSLAVVIPIGIVIVAGTAWDMLSGDARDSTMLKYAASDTASLRAEAEFLWRDIESYRVNDDDAEDRYQSICERWRKVEDKLSIAVDKKLLSKCGNDSTAVIDNTYAM